jgi:LTXXQ motif family protein
MRSRNTCASLVLVLTLAAAPALAEEPQHDQHHPAAAGAGAPMPMGMAGGQMPGVGGGMGMMSMMSQNGMGGMPMMGEHVEGRIAFLKAELKITDAQLPLWNTFAQAMRDSATAMQGMRGGMMAMSQAATLPEKLDAREKLLTARLDAARKLKAAAEPLYAALSAEQKKTADEIIVSPMGMMM